MDNLLLESKKLQSSAKELLDFLKITVILKDYGDPIFVGAFRYGVMTKKDIDIHVYNPRTKKEDALNLIKKLYELEGLCSLKFVDFVEYREALAKNPKDLPQFGYFIGLKVLWRGALWSLDISLVKERQPETIDFEKFFQTAKDETKEKVLNYKAKIKEEGLPFYSKDVYRGFIDGAGGTYEELIKYLEKIHV